MTIEDINDGIVALKVVDVYLARVIWSDENSDWAEWDELATAVHGKLQLLLVQHGNLRHVLNQYGQLVDSLAP